MKTYNVQSSAIEKIDVGENLANITFKGGREYVYQIVDPTTWVTALETEIERPDGSVGKFVNRSIREDGTLKVIVTSQS